MMSSTCPCLIFLFHCGQDWGLDSFDNLFGLACGSQPAHTICGVDISAELGLFVMTVGLGLWW